MAYSILLPKELEHELTILSKQQDRPKSYLIRTAITKYLRELKGDHEEAEIALARKNDPSRELYTSEEADEYLKKMYGI